ncbi:MAG: hypothetical protein ACPGOV_11390 [Magnetovibrionaceae bacterium]
MASKGSFDVYARQGETWSFQGTYPLSEKATALSDADLLDQTPETNGVRVMQTIDGTQNHRDKEKLVWVSPWLKSGRPKPPPRKKAPPAPVEPSSEKAEANRDNLGGSDFDPPPSSASGKAPAGLADPMAAVKQAAAVEVPDQDLEEDVDEDLTAGRDQPRTRKRVEFKPENPARIVNKLLLGIGIASIITVLVTFGMPHVSHLMASFGFSIMPEGQRSLSGSTSLAIFMITLLLTCAGLFRANDFGLKVTEELVLPGDQTGPHHSHATPSPDAVQSATPGAAPNASSVTASDPPPPAPPPDNESRAEQRYIIVRFMTGAIDAIKSDFPRLDHHTAFGLCLYIGGAVDSFAEQRGLPVDHAAVLMREIIGALQTNTERARSFCEGFAHYKTDPDYAELAKAGGVAMKLFLGADPGQAFQNLRPLMLTWADNAPS